MIRTAIVLLALAAAAPASAGAPSCLAEVGKVRAQAIADMCRFFSPATRPPCNVDNACAPMRDHIARNCTDKAKCVVPTVAGKWACSDNACSSFGFTPTRATKPVR